MDRALQKWTLCKRYEYRKAHGECSQLQSCGDEGSRTGQGSSNCAAGVTTEGRSGAGMACRLDSADTRLLDFVSTEDKALGIGFSWERPIGLRRSNSPL
jgi:hypothetical protein